MSKVREWQKVRAQLKKEFEANGITRCELRLPGCLGGLYLSFAHSKKRADIQGDELREVALTCQNCHSAIERLPKADMRKVVLDTITARALVFTD